MKIQQRSGIGTYKADGFIGKYQELVRSTVIPYQYEVLCDRAGGEKSHVIKNFENAAKALRGEDTGDGFYGMVFQDSDAAKWLEAAAYSLSVHPDSDLERRCDELISLIASAQDEDGYLNTYYTVKDRDKRWTNLLEGHELYCSGHMFEAGAAYYEATGKRELMDVCLKNARHIYKHFITDGAEGYPGHPEIELALLKLGRASNEKFCFELAEHFINVRGVDPDYFRKEAASRSWSVWGSKGDSDDYQQSGRPVREQSDATGHSVRAVYLYTAMADLAAENDDRELMAACERLWKSITERRMYVTGGIGSTVHGEAFSVDNDLPSDTAYAETCASIGLMFFASRMLEAHPDAKYADVMEQAFYNTVLAGMSRDGKRFFYVNPLECIPGISGSSPTHKHDLTQRPGWYACACCPPNVARTVMSFANYAYGSSEDTAFCHMYAAGTAEFPNGVKFVCKTGYPFDMSVNYRIEKGGRMAVRIPHWSKDTSLTVNGTPAIYELKDGYAYLSVCDGDMLVLSLDSEPRIIYGAVRVHELSGKACICRGPLVYCFEGVDNGGSVISLLLNVSGSRTITKANELPGIPAIETDALRTEDSDMLYSSEPPRYIPCKAKAVPYFCWANRGETEMRVWLPSAK